MTALYDLPAPAKLNLFLHIVGRRADGYHLLQSLFILLDLHDRIDLIATDDGRITRHDHSPTPEPTALPAEDLCTRAARLLQQRTGTRQGVHIRLTKRIPTQAGLGGGSSDAATTLLGLNRLWRLGLPRSTLADLGLRLGADVPFFLCGASAWVEGIGERITPIELPPQRFGWAKPPVGLSTADVFSHPELQRHTPPLAAERVLQPDTWAGLLQPLIGRNDLEPIARRLCPSLDHTLQRLHARGFQARMTGSGSALFAPLSPEQDWPPAEDGWLGGTCHSLPRHPLAGWAA